MTMNRRQALQSALGVYGGPLCSGLVGSLGAGCKSGASGSGQQEKSGEPSTGRQPLFEPELLSTVQAMTLEDLVELLIPETKDSPGAKQAGVAQRAESQLRHVLPEAETQAFLGGLDQLSSTAKSRHGSTFHECDAKAQQQLFAEVQKGRLPAQPAGEASNFYAMLRKLTIEGFCESKIGATRVLQYEPVPGMYKGCVSVESVGRAWATR